MKEEINGLKYNYFDPKHKKYKDEDYDLIEEEIMKISKSLKNKDYIKNE